ncbi:MAG: hypothetical protein D4R67_01780, partial [Bacteroidetes bacterium]
MYDNRYRSSLFSRITVEMNIPALFPVHNDLFGPEDLQIRNSISLFQEHQGRKKCKFPERDFSHDANIDKTIINRGMR